MAVNILDGKEYAVKAMSKTHLAKQKNGKVLFLNEFAVNNIIVNKNKIIGLFGK